MTGPPESFRTILDATLALYGLMALGAVLRRLKWLTAEADASLIRLNVQVLMPCLILSKLPGNPALDRTQDLLLAPLAGFATIAVGLLIAYGAAGPLAGLRTAHDRRTFAFIVSVYNFGYIPVPLVQMFGTPEALGLLFLFNLGVDVAVWTLGLAVLTGGEKRFSARNLITPVTLTIPFALILHYVNAVAWMPPFVVRGVDMLGQCTVPLALLTIGASAFDLVRSEASTLTFGRAAGVSCLLRLAVIPAIFIGAAWLMPIDLGLRDVLLVQAAMPCGVFSILLVRHYQGNSGLSLAAAGATWIGGLVTIPLLMRLAFR